MKKFFSYLRYSNFQVCVNFNPFVWGFYFSSKISPSQEDPGMIYALHLKVLMVRMSLIIDDGTW